jgi:hypothetical protein
MARNKYKSEPRPEEKPKGYLQIEKNFSVPLSKTPYLNDEGVLSVENIEERTSSDLSFQYDKKNESFLFAKNLDTNTEVQYVPKYVDKVYKTKVSFKGEIKEAFAVYRNEVKRFIIEELDRYTCLPKAHKKEIDTILKAKNQYIFTEDIGGMNWNKVYIDATSFGPYNYDVNLYVSKDIEMINDLIVVKTGYFDAVTALPSGGKHVAWVSSHDAVSYSDPTMYHSTGYWYTNRATGDYIDSPYASGATSFNRNFGVTNTGITNALTSKFNIIAKGQNLYSGTRYTNTVNGFGYERQNPLIDDFSYVYEESGRYRTTFNDVGWNGVIPSGVPFSIETWSTNPRYIGFDGEITIKPTGVNDPTCTYSATIEGTAQSKDYQKSIRYAMAAAKKKFYKNLNKILIQKGIKKKNSRITRYEKMLERVAQNVYDGLTVVRNENIAKTQGLESNPLDSPVYYDGTAKMYDGDNSTSLYDANKTRAYRLESGSAAQSQTSSSSSSSGGSY